MDKWHYHPGVVELARIAQFCRELGAVLGIHSRRVTLGHRYSDVDTVWIHALHDLVIAHDLLGEIPAPRSAGGGGAGRRRASPAWSAIFGETRRGL